MADRRTEDKHSGAAVSSSSSLESVNSADVDVSLGSVESTASTRASLPNLYTSKSTDSEEPIKDWQDIFQPLLTGELDGGSGVPTFQAWLDLFASGPSQQLFRQGSTTPVAVVPPAPPLPVQLPMPRKTKKAPSPPTTTRILPSRSLDFGPTGARSTTTAAMSTSPPSASDMAKAAHQQTQTVFQSSDRYRYYLKAATSMMTPHGEDTITYLNKGQFYDIVFEGNRFEHAGMGSIGLQRKVRSYVSLVFREEKDEESELHHWEYWHSQQPNQMLRAFDVDRKSVVNVESVDDVSYNASAFVWDPSVPARVSLRVNCLSTEFSPQKGIRGMPLFLQIDTFEDGETEASHRCYCKIKIFRDKGAERKKKDESKSADRRMAKILKQQQHTRRRGTNHHRAVPFPSGSSSVASSTVHESEQEQQLVSSASCSASSWKPPPQPPPVAPQPAPPPLQTAGAATASGGDPSGFFQAPSQVTMFTTTSTLGRKPAFFIPREMPKPLTASAPALFDSSALSAQLVALVQEKEQQRALPGRVDAAQDELSNLDMGGPRSKNPRTERRLPAVTVYIRKEEEKVYNAIMLDQLSVQELSVKVGEKYDIPAGFIKNVYKRTKRGILVNLDDRMVQQFVNEDDFVIQVVFDNQLGQCDLYFHY